MGMLIMTLVLVLRRVEGLSELVIALLCENDGFVV